MPNKVKIDVHHITRVEGHGNIKVDIENGELKECKLEIVEAPRFFEAMLKGRHYDEAALITSRICGICSAGHQLTSLKASEDAFGIEISKQEKLLRRLLNVGEQFESHVLHIYFLAVPDFVGAKSVLPLVNTHKDIVVQALKLKKLGHYVGDVLATFSVDAVPGSKNPSPEVIASEDFANRFMKYAWMGGFGHAMKLYRAIPRSKDVSFQELLGLSTEDLENIRSKIEGKLSEFDNIDEIAQRATGKISDMLEEGAKHASSKSLAVEERVDDQGMRSFYIRGTNVLHREDGPAAMGPAGAKMWMRRGELHREDGPALVFPDGGEAYWQNGKVHRIDGPAITSAEGDHGYAIFGVFITKEFFDDAQQQGLIPQETATSVIWTKDGLPHNEKGPAIFTSSAQYWSYKGHLHRLDGPAAVYADGKEGFFLHGFPFTEKEIESIRQAKLAITKTGPEGNTVSGEENYKLTFNDGPFLHREDGPAVIYKSGEKRWYNKGRPHNLNGPAKIDAFGNKSYYIHGHMVTEIEHKSIADQGLGILHTESGLYFSAPGSDTLHRADGPALIAHDGSIYWYRNGDLHRDDGPAVVKADGTQLYYTNGERNRYDGPAVIKPDGQLEFWVDGELHRDDGPAVLYADGAKAYWINGVTVSEEEFNEIVDNDLEIQVTSDGTRIISKESDGNYHRVNGPAVTRENGQLEWFFEGDRHREDGPAIVRNGGGDSYYLAGKVLISAYRQYISCYSL